MIVKYLILQQQKVIQQKRLQQQKQQKKKLKIIVKILSQVNHIIQLKEQAN